MQGNGDCKWVCSEFEILCSQKCMKIWKNYSSIHCGKVSELIMHVRNILLLLQSPGIPFKFEY
jgi:hypothetical protein